MESLKSILTGGFKLSYCKEELWAGMFRGIPMISYCDIPLTRTSNHRKDYGSYAIGVDKNIFMNKYKEMLNPVFYYHADMVAEALKFYSKKYDELNNKFEDKFDHLQKDYEEKGILNKKEEDGKEFTQIHNLKDFPWLVWIKRGLEGENLSSLLACLKPYSFNPGTPQEHVNYNESEWRIALYDFYRQGEKTIKWLITEEEYNVWRGDRESPKPLLDYTINFAIQDINHVIVPQDSDIEPLVKFLSSSVKIGGHKTNEEHISVLLTKITSFERLEADW